MPGEHLLAAYAPDRTTGGDEISLLPLDVDVAWA